MKKERAQKIIAASGIMSRRKAESAIVQGRVSLNGDVFHDLGRLVDPSTDTLTVDGEKVTLPLRKRTFLFYKPRGVVTTKSDPDGKPTVMSYFKDVPGVNPAGRLDEESEGLLVMTEDGDLLLKLTHPRFGKMKVYEVEVQGRGRENFREDLCREVQLSDGPGRFESLLELEKNSLFEVTVGEGRNRFVRRMFAAVGLTVVFLKRTRMGEYSLGSLAPGERLEVD
ncbi:MAG: rRNA pseudouridine synthase [Bdellovibrionales bacterium]|nr:rRNA pseudouridine synthase [Bdellovibrionales bacterium]